MRSGALDRTIELQRETTSISPAGTRTSAWATFATVRAQLLERSTKETLADHGEADTGRVAFRIRYRADLTTAARVLYEGTAFNLREIAEIGRRRGLDLRCEASE